VWPAMGVAALVVLALGWSSVLLFGRGLWMEVASPVLAVALAAFGGTAYQYVVEGREKRQVKRTFSRFVSKDVYEQLVADPASARVGGARRDMSVLFADIRGFTTFTEQGRPEEVVAQLNEYFSRMVEVVFAHRGTVDKFVGDMVMALFGAPLADADHADHAVRAALGMLAALQELNARWAAEGRPALDIGIGVNSGDMVAGIIGSDTVMSYTVIGDAVNLGSRLESLNKEYGTHLIVSEATKARLKGRYDMKPLGAVTVKGKSEPVNIFEVLARQDRQE
jgi:adenylate cyclase